MNFEALAEVASEPAEGIFGREGESFEDMMGSWYRNNGDLEIGVLWGE
jgi:hypothetical protein